MALLRLRIVTLIQVHVNSNITLFQKWRKRLSKFLLQKYLRMYIINKFYKELNIRAVEKTTAFIKSEFVRK